MALYGASSSSSPIRPRAYYDVFLSFRGEDTRRSFTGHLCSALRRTGINTFMDDTLERGDEISPALVKAIDQSTISIIVLSKNYASSGWCLDELMKVLECREKWGQQVLPLFYDVDPADIRRQINCVGEAFAKLEERFKNDEMKVKEWKEALKKVANLPGMHLGNKDESKFIDEIIEWLNWTLAKKIDFEVAQHPIGIESHIQQLKSLLDIEKNNGTCMLGILGMGGIGKTTIAKAIYNSIAFRFEVSCFLENIRETFQKEGPIHLQKKLLSKIITNPKIGNVDEGITLIRERLSSKRVLLILDDVDHSSQLEKIARESDWFGLGSRIIITTRDNHLLTQHQALPYKVEGLDENTSLQLFSWHAFNRDRPDPDFLELAQDAVCYTRGLPLALTLLGSTLKGRDILYWKSKLDVYKRIPNENILQKLRISYDGLEKNVKNVFLDIACFFKGQGVTYVTKALDSFGFHSYSSIEELKDKCLITESLITESRGQIEMHDLLQEMGREIVRQESPEEPGKRSRLWFHEDVCHVLREDTGTNKVEAILINLPGKEIYLNSETFEKMKKLRLLIIAARCYGEPNFRSNKLRLLDWNRYQGESLPSNFYGNNLVVLKLEVSKLKTLEGVQNFQNMRIMDFSSCKFIREIPDVSRLSNLEELILSCCRNLVEVHCSVGLLDKLVVLNLNSCYNLTILPRSFRLRSLERLDLMFCRMLKTFPEIEFPMEVLEFIGLEYTGIEELPSSIGYLVGLKQLHLSDCRDLTNLPHTIYKLQHLKELNLLNCKGLQEILRLPPNVVEVQAAWCESLAIFLEEPRRSQLLNMWDPPEPEGVGTTSSAPQSSSLGNNVVTESDFVIERDCPRNLKVLDLSNSAIVSLPAWLNEFAGLEELYLSHCKKLEEIPELPPNIKNVCANGCTSLERFQYNNINDLPMLEWIEFSDCHRLRENMGDDLQIRLMSEGHPKKREFGCIFPGNKIPDCFSQREAISYTDWCEININEPLHLDLENTIFAFSAVIETEDVEDEVCFRILVEVINNGQLIYCHRSIWISYAAGSDHVYLHYSGSPHSRLKMDNLRVTFKLEFGSYSKTVILKTCGFHLQHRYEEDAIDLMDRIQHSKRSRGDDDDGNLESNCYPQQKRHSSILGISIPDVEETPLGESQLHQSNHPGT